MRLLFRGLVLLTGLIFLSIGLGFFVAPGNMVSPFSIHPSSNAGFGTLRGDLGGLFLGMAAFSLLGAVTSKRRWLIVPTVFLVAVALGRVVNLIFDGVSGPGVQSLLLEVVLLFVLIGSLRTFPRDPLTNTMKTSAVAKTALILFALLSLVAGGAVLFQRKVGLAIAKRVIDQRVAIDLAAEQPDGLHVCLCGTGSPIADPKRAGPCVFVIAGKRLYVIDAGDGATRNMALMGLQMGRIDAILLTHFHSDHIASLGEMMLVRWASTGNSQPVEVFGPQGVESVVEGFNRAYELDKAYRVAHHGADIVPPSGAGGVARPFTLPEGEETKQTILERDGLTVTAFSVDHSPVFPAVGYRFDYKGRSVVISGDTVPSRNLSHVSNGVDLLVHEGLQAELVGIIHDAAVRHGRKNLAAITADIPSYHTAPEDAAKIARQAGVRHLAFYHIIPPLPFSYFNAAYLGGADTFYEGPMTVGTDGLLFSLPADSDVIGLQRLLRFTS
jgi:ribonuclease Z